MSGTVIAGLIGAVVGAMAIVVLMPSNLFGRVPVLSGTVNADYPEVAVVDGGTLRLRDAVIRLQGVHAPARGQVCPAPGGSLDCGAAAIRQLAALVRGHSVACHLAGRNAAGFPQARCEAAGAELNRALIASGWARADAADLQAEEATARQRRAGLWRDGGEAPSF